MEATADEPAAMGSTTSKGRQGSTMVMEQWATAGTDAYGSEPLGESPQEREARLARLYPWRTLSLADGSSTIEDGRQHTEGTEDPDGT